MAGGEVDRLEDVAGARMRVGRRRLGGDRLRAVGVPFVSAGAVPFGDRALGFSAATMVRDSDGHALRVLGRQRGT